MLNIKYSSSKLPWGLIKQHCGNWKMVLTYLFPKDHMPGFNLGFNHGSSNFVDVDFNQTLDASTLAQGNEQNPTDCEVEGTENLISIESFFWLIIYHF